MAIDKRIVPALMFHSVGLQNYPWAWSRISEALESFESKIALLRKKGFTGVFWSELFEYMGGRRTLPENSILLTFDDGYLDNWVYVYPILKKYDMKGTIFMSTDFVDPHAGVRPNLDDLRAGRRQQADLEVAGFLSWDEMRAMEASGLVDIQSHATTHTWYFSGPAIVDYHAPHAVPPNPWLFWNARPDRKPFYLKEDQQEFVPWGSPILEHQKSLTARRFFPDESVMAEVAEFVETAGGRTYFDRPDWRQGLEKRVETLLQGDGLPGVYEDDGARVERVTEELRMSKMLIERNLGKQVDFICWPGGANDHLVQDLASKVGYKSWTLGSQSQVRKKNLPGADPTSIKRIATTNRLQVRGRQCGTGGGNYQVWRVLAHQGSTFHLAAVWALKLAAYATSLGGTR